MMDLFETVKARHSIRAFQSRSVEEGKVNRIIETVNLAPSAGDLQAYEIVVVKDSRRRNELAKASGGQGFISEAPVCLVFLTYPERSSRKYGKRGSELYCIQDATIAAAYAQLAATALGQVTLDRWLSRIKNAFYSREWPAEWEAVASAHENYIQSLYAHNLAKVELAYAIGDAEQGVKRYLKGIQ